MKRAALFVSISLFAAALAGPAAGDLADRAAQPQPPNEAECGGDRVIGVWRAPRNHEREWNYQITLHIQRVPNQAGAIQGRIVGNWWDGNIGVRLPPPCSAGQTAFQITQQARGVVEEERRISFRAFSYRVSRTMCGGATGYSLDHFVGTFDASAPILRAVNNDGGAAVNEPEVFRRIRCR